MTKATKQAKTYRIYLSPANHPKPYAIKGCNEKQQMEKLAPLLKEKLAEYEGVEVVHTTLYNPDQSYTGRPEEALAKGCNLYVALHTNAGGGKGACTFYHPYYRLSKEIALSVVKELNRICPIKSNRAVQPAIYSWDGGAFNFGELRVPAFYGIPPVLIEHEFHDTKEGALWITSSTQEIAEADAKAIADALGLKKKPIRGDVNGDGEATNLDAALILRYDAGLIDIPDDRLKAADYNGDGTVNHADAYQILKSDIE